MKMADVLDWQAANEDSSDGKVNSIPISQRLQ
jgi:hypothetical protein